MGKSKHRKGHAQKVAAFKQQLKNEKDSFRKKMIDQFMASQQQMQEYKTTEEVEVDIDTDGLGLEGIEMPDEQISELPEDINIEENTENQ